MRRPLCWASLSLIPLIALAAGVSPRAQTAATPAPLPAFEVASVKRNTSDDGRVMMGMQPGGRLTMTGVTLRMLITRAYGIQNYQLVGGPDWLERDRFDILARAEAGSNPTPADLNLMLRSLLADRFKLIAHPETRELEIWALVHARDDKRPGPNMTPAAAECGPGRGGRGPRAGGPPPPPTQPPPPLEPGQRPTCGMMMGFGRLDAGGMPMAQLATMLSQQVGRMVVDRTGLTGNYDFSLEWAPEGRGGGVGAPSPPGGGPPFVPAASPDAPSIFTALQEQLGLKLESQRAPAEVIVIDSVQPPTED